MVTTINISNRDGYKKLFSEATEKLRAKGLIEEKYEEISLTEDEFNGQTDEVQLYYVKLEDGSYERATNWSPNVQYYTLLTGINTLEEYFCNIDHLLGTLDGDEAEFYEPKYIMLPLDEEPFAIDANARTITVPANFRRNGVAVQGDEIAEMLYFTIDRYFDAVDFDTADIYIQWETPMVGGKSEQYLTQICSAEENSGLKELTRYPGKILFGWPLTSKVTATPGTLKFSVRIIKKDEVTNTIAYSFSTLTATVNINPGLNYDMTSGDIKLDNYYTLFQAAITNSQNTEGIDADMPKFVYDLDNKTPVYLVNDGIGAIWSDDGSIKVAAAVEDTGTITYKWYYQEDASTPRVFLGYEGKGLRPDTDNPIWVPQKAMESINPDINPYLKSFYEKRNELVTYYTKTVGDNGEPAWIPYAGDSFEADKDDLFIRLSQLTIRASVPSDDEFNDYHKIIGYYYCVAVNRLNNKEKSNSSFSIIIPGAQKLDLKTNLSEHYDKNGNDVTKEENPEVAYEQGYIDADSSLEVSVSADTGDSHSVLTYAWSRANTIDGDYVEITENVTSEGNITKLAISENGYYKMQAKNMVNLDVMPNETAPLKVTFAPQTPVITKTTDGSSAILVNPTAVEYIEIAVENIADYSNPLLSEELIYTWHIDTDSTIGTIENTIIQTSLSHTNPNQLTIAKLQEEIGAEEMLGAVVYCTVSNRIGSKESVPSDFSDQYIIYA